MAFMPDLMASSELHAVYLVPTAVFQRQYYAKRELAWELLAQTSDPQASFERWMARDALTAQDVTT